MKHTYLMSTILLLTLILAACGDDTAGDPRKENPPGTEVNEAPAPPGTACSDRSECNSNAECIDGHCVEHLQCKKSNFSGGESFFDGKYCNARWWQCPNLKTYHFDCGTTYPFCKCKINDVEVGEFRWSRELTEALGWCKQATVHRVVNDYCGWNVNAIP